jgi:hypothetical protein
MQKHWILIQIRESSISKHSSRASSAQSMARKTIIKKYKN